MREGADSGEVEELRERLLAERRQAEETAWQEEVEAEEEAARRERAEAAEFAATLGRIANLAPKFVRERQAKAELVAAPTSHRTGWLRKKVETRLEEQPAWEIAAGTGTKIATDKEGSRSVELAYRFMLLADGRLLYGIDRVGLARNPDLPTAYHEISLTEPPREALAACGLPSASHVAKHVERLAADAYESPVEWE